MVRGEASESRLYRVMTLDAAQKSYFCNPNCYDKFRLERQAAQRQKKRGGKKKKIDQPAPDLYMTEALEAKRAAWYLGAGLAYSPNLQAALSATAMLAELNDDDGDGASDD